MCGPEDPPFSHPPGSLQDTHFVIYSSQDPTSTPNYKFLVVSSSNVLKLAEFRSKALKWAKIQFTWLYFVKKFSSQGSQI